LTGLPVPRPSQPLLFWLILRPFLPFLSRSICFFYGHHTLLFLPMGEVRVTWQWSDKTTGDPFSWLCKSRVVGPFNFPSPIFTAALNRSPPFFHTGTDSCNFPRVKLSCDGLSDIFPPPPSAYISSWTLFLQASATPDLPPSVRLLFFFTPPRHGISGLGPGPRPPLRFSVHWIAYSAPLLQTQLPTRLPPPLSPR